MSIFCNFVYYLFIKGMYYIECPKISYKITTILIENEKLNWFFLDGKWQIWEVGQKV